MKFRSLSRIIYSLVLLLCFFVVSVGAAPKKSLRLRNEIITPEASERKAPSNSAIANERFSSGLFLIQFTGTPQPQWREELRSLNVELLRYVPDDAFVAKFNGTKPSQVRQLDFVRWVGPYRPEHKMHPKLRRDGVKDTNELVNVAILLSPRISEADSRSVKRSLQSVGQEFKHRFGSVIRGRATAAQLNTLANSDAVLWVEPAPAMKLFDEVSSRIVGGDGPPGQTLVQSLGYNGSGVTVAVADSGLDSGDTNTMHPDISGRVRALIPYGSLPDAADEHSHGTHVAGIIAGNGAVGEMDENDFLYGLGVAPGASIVAQRIFDANGGYVLPPDFDFETLTRNAKSAGAEIGSNSWGDDTQGRYDISAMEFDALVRDADALTLGDQQYILEFSAGNAGPGLRTIGSPAVAKNVIATGADNSDRVNLPIEEFSIYDTGPDTMADFSSRGPCEDGRIKPDVVAPGTWIASLRSVYANDDYAWWPISDNYMYQGGTSQAGPHVSGAAAVFVQFYRTNHGGATPSPALVKAALINSAADMDNTVETGPVPNMDEGWGRVDLPALVASTRDYDFVDQTTLLTNNAVYEKRVLVGDANESLKVTLAYTDVPGLPAAAVALVNDLDLEVESPDGHVYRGNQFFDGESLPDATSPDSINNVEAVHLFAPPPGEYVIRVRATRVVEDARSDSLVVDQDFALVVSATFAAPGVGMVTFNRSVYRAPDQIKLTLVDYDLAGQSTANIVLRSGTEPAGETITLHANGVTGLFTGAVATVTGSATVDGKLQIAHGNTIEAVYADALPAASRIFTAGADLLPPVISNIQATNEFGQIVISWDTDEDARTFLFYGTNTPSLGLTNNALDVSHEFTLANIATNATVKFFVVAEDEAGNRTTNNNGGFFFNVVNPQTPGILLLDSFTDFFPGFVDAPPLSGYTNALNAIGVAYSFFDARSGAEPTLAQLKSYRCVIWRVDDLVPPAVTLAGKITNYVNSGGSLLIASMEALSRFSEAGLDAFNNGTLRVQSYTVDQPVNDIAGYPGEPVGNGINTTLDYSPYENILAVVGVDDPSDWLSATTNAASVILSDGHVVGVRSPKTGFDLPGRVVFLSFPLDSVPLGSGVGNNRSGLLKNILNFLVLPRGASAITLDSSVYSESGHPVVELEDADLQGQEQTVISIHSPQLTNAVNVTLTETVRPGLFRGSFVLVPTNSTVPATVLAHSGDTIHADYYDTSASQTVSVSAIIETNPPVITNVFIEPGYLEAFASWETSEDSDSLVQYSETPDFFPVNQTSYDPSLVKQHELLLDNLKPNQIYYARVVSRDRAGNTTIDDNTNQFYIFTTLQPKVTPWQDNMETNSVEWSTFTVDGAETDWTRGKPGGGESAHSPTNCWGSNLGGGPIGLTECFLISPGILLTGGNKATLRFWQNYDFPVTEFDVEYAFVEIITNITTSQQVLMQLPLESSSFGWEQVELDLTPHINKVVYIVWHYVLFAVEPQPRMGWLVDDASITVTNVVPGTIQITNNLWQALFALSGPTSTSGHGRSTLLTNAVPGQYVIQFGDVLHYVTPSSQTNNLTAGGQITFQGNYTFTDANANGIPDPWELQHFGIVDPLRTGTTDTDGDGMSDSAEFVAGTDPNSPAPSFRLYAKLLPNNLVQLYWPSVTNHTYRVHGTANATTWSPYSNWLPAAGTNTTFTLPTPTNGAPYLFRVEAAPPSGPGALPVSLLLTAKLTNGLVRLDWPSSLNHGYRVWGSSNATNWSPYSSWIQASGSTTGFTLPPATNGAPYLFRVEVAP